VALTTLTLAVAEESQLALAAFGTGYPDSRLYLSAGDQKDLGRLTIAQPRSLACRRDWEMARLLKPDCVTDLRTEQPD